MIDPVAYGGYYQLSGIIIRLSNALPPNSLSPGERGESDLASLPLGEVLGA
jgi:hypothetical protein